MVDRKKDMEDGWEGIFWESHKYNERKRLKTGSYLRSFCPHCEKELTSDNFIKLEVVRPDDEIGILALSAYLNVFDKKTDIKIPEGEEVKDLRCPHCHRSLKIEGQKCGNGDAHVAGFLIAISNTKIPFMICMRAGCHWHAISVDGKNQIILDDSHEW